jgi:uncharacterized protein (UPF0332 family)
MKDDEILVLIKHRLEQAEESLKDAEVLLDGDRSPRSIINRSYYAMFYAVLALLQKIGRVPHKHSGAIFIRISFLGLRQISHNFPNYLP